MDPSALWNDASIRQNLVATVLLLLVALGLRAAAKRAIERANITNAEVRLRWVVAARNLSLGVFLLGGVIIWASEIQSFALSVVAIAAAIVLATKELILCMSGAVLRAGSGAYSVGDRIEIGAIRGDVIDIALLSTTLLEVGPAHQRTGRAITVPNSVLLSQAVVNETFMDEYVLQVVKVPIDPNDDDWQRCERALLESGREAAREYVEPARRFMDALSKKHGLPPLSVEPRVQIAIPSASELQLLLRVPTPVRERARVEQAVLRGYLARTSATSSG